MATSSGPGGRSGPGRRSRASAPIGGYPRRRGHLRLLKGLLALVIAFFVIEVAVNPWTFHIGDRFTPLTGWDGYGTVRASNGGHYVLFTHLQGTGLGSSCSFTGCDTLQGSAKICTERGSTYTFRLLGSVRRVAEREIGLLEDLSAPLRSRGSGLTSDQAQSVTVELAGDCKIGVQLRILEVRDSRWMDARFTQPVIEPRRGAVAEIHADGGVNRRKDLQRDENDSHRRERAGEVTVMLHSGDEHAHHDREQRGEHAAEDEHYPPRDGKLRVDLGEGAEKLPLFSLGNRKHRD